MPWVVVGLARLLSYFVSHGIMTPFLERLGIASGLAALDRQGSVLVASLLTQSMGLAAGAALAGMLISGTDYSRFGWLCFAGYAEAS